MFNLGFEKKIFLAAVAIILLTGVSSFDLAFAPSAKIDASDSVCSAANINLFPTKGDVYIFGSGLPAGNYYVEVTSTSGSSLGDSGLNTLAVGVSGDLACIQLNSIVSFSDSSNGNYKVRISLNSDFSDGVFDVFKVGTQDPQNASITLIKDPLSVYGGNNGPDTFGLTIDGSSVTSGQTVTFTTLPASIEIGENDPSLSGYSFVSIVGDGCPLTLTGLPGNPITGTVSLAAGDVIICVITNQDIQPSITLTKTIQTIWGTELQADFEPSIGGNIVTSGVKTYVNSNSQIEINEIQPNLYGYEFVASTTDDIKCPDVLGGTIILDEGEDAACEIINHDTRGKLIVKKFYDANANGSYESPPDFYIDDWVFSKDGVLYYTPQTFLLTPGTYPVTESLPLENNWIKTKPTSSATLYPEVVTGEETRAKFGNLCTGPGGGMTLGFWSNKNGASLFGSDDLALMVSLNLRKANGDPFDPATYNGSPSSTAFRPWLLGASATNMAYMLSAQLAAMELNVYNGKVSGTALIYAPGTTSANTLGFATVNAVMTEANNTLASNGLVLSGNPERTHEEALKNALDNANNNKTFVQPTVCPFTFREYPAP